MFLINDVRPIFLFIKESWKNISQKKLLSSTTDFNFDNDKKCFLSTKSTYYNYFWEKNKKEIHNITVIFDQINAA